MNNIDFHICQTQIVNKKKKANLKYIMVTLLVTLLLNSNPNYPSNTIKNPHKSVLNFLTS